MGADIRMYLEKYDNRQKQWVYAGPYTMDGKIVPIVDVRARHYEPYFEELCMVDRLHDSTDMSYEVFEYYRDHFDQSREEYDGIYMCGAVQLSEMDRACLRKPEVEDDDADDEEWIELPNGNVKPPLKPNPLRQLYDLCVSVADMMSHFCFDDRYLRVVFFCDN